MTVCSTALSSGDVSIACSLWLYSAVVPLVSAFLSAGGLLVRVLSAVVVQLGSDRSSLVVLWFGKAGAECLLFCGWSVCPFVQGWLHVWSCGAETQAQVRSGGS